MADFDSVVLSGTTYEVPRSGANPQWGEQLNDYLVALGEAYGTLVGIGDIAETGFTIANNQAVSASITGLSFDSSLVRAASIAYSIYRTTDTNVKKEAGQINVLYDSSASIGEKWALQRDSIGDADVDITISDTGVVSYTSSNLAGASYTGLLKFEARATLQT